MQRHIHADALKQIYTCAGLRMRIDKEVYGVLSVVSAVGTVIVIMSFHWISAIKMNTPRELLQHSICWIISNLAILALVVALVHYLL